MLRAILSLCGVLAVAACTPPEATRSVSLGDGSIAAQAPLGYCVDRAASQPRRDFAVFVPCAALAQSDDVPDVVGLVTVQVGPEESGQIAQDEIALRDFLISDQGTQLLSQTGDSTEITILSSQAFSDQVMVHFADTGAPPLAGLQPEEWRAFRDIGGRLVTIGVRGLASAPLPDGIGAGLLKLIIAGVRATASEEAEITAEG